MYFSSYSHGFFAGIQHLLRVIATAMKSPSCSNLQYNSAQLAIQLSLLLCVQTDDLDSLLLLSQAFLQVPLSVSASTPSSSSSSLFPSSVTDPRLPFEYEYTADTAAQRVFRTSPSSQRLHLNAVQQHWRYLLLTMYEARHSDRARSRSPQWTDSVFGVHHQISIPLVLREMIAALGSIPSIDVLMSINSTPSGAKAPPPPSSTVSGAWGAALTHNTQTDTHTYTHRQAHTHRLGFGKTISLSIEELTDLLLLSSAPDFSTAASSHLQVCDQFLSSAAVQIETKSLAHEILDLVDSHLWSQSTPAHAAMNPQLWAVHSIEEEELIRRRPFASSSSSSSSSSSTTPSFLSSSVDPRLQPFVRRVQVYSQYQIGPDWELLFPYEPEEHTASSTTNRKTNGGMVLPRFYEDMGMAAHWGVRLAVKEAADCQPQHSGGASASSVWSDFSSNPPPHRHQDSNKEEGTCPCCGLAVHYAVFQSSAQNATYRRSSWQTAASVIAFQCGHVYHASCLSEQACVVCFQEQFCL